MALLEILQLPDPRLRNKAEPISTIDKKLRQFVDDMYETMYEVNGVGLAATQVGVSQRIFVMDVSEKRDEPYCVINPEILSSEGEQMEMEGCLSVVGAYDKVIRPLKVRFKGMDIEGKWFEFDTSTVLMAACVQHEMDHLNGKLFIDRLSKLKQERIRKKIEKNKRR